MADGTTGSPELAYDTEKMQVAANFINQEFSTLITSLEQIKSTFSDYIGAGGTALDFPTLSTTLSEMFMQSMNDGLNDFSSHFSEWSDVISLVNATAADYTDKALSAYGVDTEAAKAGFLGSIHLDDLTTSLNFEDRLAINEIFDLNKTYTQDEWNDIMNKATDAQKRGIEARNREMVDTYYYTYKKLMDGETTSTALQGVIDRQNPGLKQMLADKYAEESGMS